MSACTAPGQSGGGQSVGRVDSRRGRSRPPRIVPRCAGAAAVVAGGRRSPRSASCSSVAGLGRCTRPVVAGSKRYSDGIEKLARGLANCATTLDVAKEAHLLLHVETKGEARRRSRQLPEPSVTASTSRATATPSMSAARRGRRVGAAAPGRWRDLRQRRLPAASSPAAPALDAGPLLSSAVEADDDVVVAVGPRRRRPQASACVLPIIVGPRRARARPRRPCGSSRPCAASTVRRCRCPPVGRRSPPTAWPTVPRPVPAGPCSAEPSVAGPAARRPARLASSRGRPEVDRRRGGERGCPPPERLHAARDGGGR